MKKLQHSALFFVTLMLFGCESTTEPIPEPVSPIVAMVGSYEGDFSVQCKNATTQGSKETSKRIFTISRIGTTDSITVVSTNDFLLKAKTDSKTAFVFNKTDLFGEIHTGSGTIIDNKLTMTFTADATVAYGYSCVKEFSGAKRLNNF